VHVLSSSISLLGLHLRSIFLDSPLSVSRWRMKFLLICDFFFLVTRKRPTEDTELESVFDQYDTSSELAGLIVDDEEHEM